MKAFNIKKVMAVLSVGLGLTMVYTNCADVEFADAPVESIKSVPPEVIDDALKTCADAKAKGQLSTISQTINFADTRIESGRTKVCKFKAGPVTDDTPDVDGNLTEKNDYLRARYEQKSAALNVPANAVVCSAEIKAVKQQFYYDDIFYFTFNDIVLASSLKRSNASLDSATYQVDGQSVAFHKYDWSKITAANTDFKNVNSVADDYCVGGAQGMGQCTWPLSQQSGFVEMAWLPEIMVPVSLFATSPAQKFGFVVTGDNDPDDDCYHEDFDLNVKVEYFLM